MTDYAYNAYSILRDIVKKKKRSRFDTMRSERKKGIVY